MNTDNIHILGGGPAGMACAYYAKKNNLPVKVYEKSNYIGGNCRTLEFEGFRFDTGAHRFHDKIPHITSEIKKILNGDLVKVSAPSKIFYNEQLFHFPIRFIDILKKNNPRININIFKEILSNQFNKIDHNPSFKDFAYNAYGKTLSELFLINYTEKLWGHPAHELSPSISGGRLRDLNLLSVFKELFFNNFIKAKHLDGSFYYPSRGYGTIFDSISSIVGAQNLYFNNQIVKIIHDNDRLKKIVFKNDEAVSIKNLISTIPLTSFIKLLDPAPNEKIINIINDFKFRSLFLCIILIDKPKCTENASIYFPNSKIPFTRIYEPNNRSIKMSPSNKTSLIVEIPENQGTILDESKQAEYIDRTVNELIKKDFLNKKNIISTKLINIPYAYPIIEKGIDFKLDKVFKYLKTFKNLCILGRSAQFKYIHTHDLFYTAEKTIKNLLNKGKING